MAIDVKYLRHEGIIKEVAKLVTEDVLGNGAFQNSGSSPGDLMMVGNHGWGAEEGLPRASNLDERMPSGFYNFTGSAVGAPFSGPGLLINIDRTAAGRLQLASRQLVGTGTTNTLMVRVFGGTSSSPSPSPWFEIWHSGTATVDSNGFLVESSPVIRLFSDKIEDNGQVGHSEFTRNGTGDYTITDTHGFARDGWYIKTPQDANGNIKVFVEYEYVDGDINVRTFEPLYDQGKAAKGVPVDIPDGRWIDLRLHQEPDESDKEPVEDATGEEGHEFMGD